MVMYSVIFSGEELYHHGVRGQKWGVRRYQNPDGSLTPEGYRHYGKHPEEQTPAIREQMKRFKAKQEQTGGMRRSSSVSQPINRQEDPEAAARRRKMIKRVAIAAGVAAVAAAGAVYVSRHPETIAAGKQKIAEFISKRKGKEFSSDELKKMGIDVVEPNKIEIDKFEPDKFEFDKFEPNKIEVTRTPYKLGDKMTPQEQFEESKRVYKKITGKDAPLQTTKDIDDYFLGDKDNAKPKINLTTNPGVNPVGSDKQKELLDGWTKEANRRTGITGDGLTQSGMTGKSGLMKHAEDDFEKELLRSRNSSNGGKMGALFLKDRNQNCQFCTTAYEAKRRGLSVKANRRVAGGAQTDVEDWFKGAKTENLVGGDDLGAINDWTRTSIKKYDGKVPFMLTGDDAIKAKKAQDAMSRVKRNMSDDEINSVYDKLLAQGEGARGNLQGIYGRKGLDGSFSLAGGHSIGYEVHNGKVYIIDDQIGNIYKDRDGAKSALKNMAMVSATRTDNLEFTDEGKKAFTEVKGLKDRLKGEELNDLGKSTVATAGMATTAGIISAMSTKSRQNAINNYKKEHPNTNMTDQEILQAYAENQKKERNKS